MQKFPFGFELYHHKVKVVFTNILMYSTLINTLTCIHKRSCKKTKTTEKNNGLIVRCIKYKYVPIFLQSMYFYFQSTKDVFL